MKSPNGEHFLVLYTMLLSVCAPYCNHTIGQHKSQHTSFKYLFYNLHLPLMLPFDFFFIFDYLVLELLNTVLRVISSILY